MVEASRHRDSRRYHASRTVHVEKKKYIVKADEVVELLVRAVSSACNSLTYATDIAIPTVSDYEDFTMPTKPDITTLKVKGTDKM